MARYETFFDRNYLKEYEKGLTPVGCISILS